MGANTIRLAHYQHAQEFYDLCDERGLVVWAEIPYISSHMPNGRDNTVSQMKELIYQNYNHPCIVTWGLSNEITMGGAANKDMLENHRILNDLVHSIDKTRPTTMAVLTICDPSEEITHISDILSYNHYFGWYGGNVSMYGPWFDNYHKKYPNRVIGISEYGCEALNWHTSEPEQATIQKSISHIITKSLSSRSLKGLISGQLMCGICLTLPLMHVLRAERTE